MRWRLRRVAQASNAAAFPVDRCHLKRVSWVDRNGDENLLLRLTIQ